MTVITRNLLIDKKVDGELLLQKEIAQNEQTAAPAAVVATTQGTRVAHPAARRRHARSTRGVFFYLVYSLLGLALLAAGVFLAVFVLQQVRSVSHDSAHRLKFKCGVQLMRSGQITPLQLLERVQFARNVERLDLPRWNRAGGASVLHLFDQRITAVYDHSKRICFIKKMNPSMKSPTNVMQLISQIRNGVYIPKARVVRQHWRARRPSLRPSEVKRRYGVRVYSLCGMARATFELVPRRWPPQPLLPLCPMLKCRACKPGFEMTRNRNGCPSCRCVKIRKQPMFCKKMKCRCLDERYTVKYNILGCKVCKCVRPRPLIKSRRRRTADDYPAVFKLPDTAVAGRTQPFFELVVHLDK